MFIIVTNDEVFIFVKAYACYHPFLDPWQITRHASYLNSRQNVPVGVPLDLSTPTGMSCIGTYGEN